MEDYRRLMISEMNDAVSRNIALRRQMRFVLSALVLGIAGIIVVGSILLIRRIITPVIALSRTAERFGRGEFDARVPVFRNDELGGLSRTINNMADDIARREKSRMEFSAAVFHDIKNPLAVIGGAVRMMRRKEMPRDQLEQWLDRVIRETDRLEDISQDLMDIDVAKERAKALYEEDTALPEHKSHHNKQLQELYKNFLGEANGHKAHELLHTHYHKRAKYPDGVLS